MGIRCLRGKEASNHPDLREEVELLGLELRGRRAVVIGRSNLFGKPMAQLLTAAGRARMVKGDWVRPGAAVIDVGINRTAGGLVGDVECDSASRVAVTRARPNSVW